MAHAEVEHRLPSDSHADALEALAEESRQSAVVRRATEPGSNGCLVGDGSTQHAAEAVRQVEAVPLY